MDTAQLQKIAREVRKDLLKMIVAANSGHTAGSLSSADLYVALYFAVMNHDPQTPTWEDRDRLVVSCGHTAPALYATLARAGYFPASVLKTHRRLGSILQGHPVRGATPGVETTSGPLGSGLAQACGMALGAKMDGKRFRIFCLTSDGEHDSGNHWEAVLFAAKYRLANLTLLVDRNQIQIDGNTETVLPLDSLEAKYHSFNWQVVTVNGHCFEEIVSAVAQARAVYEKPTVIVANTIAGKGVSLMEEDYTWHGKVPTKEELQQALKELSSKDAS